MFEKQHDMVIYGRNARCHRNIERDRATIFLRHIRSYGIPADLPLSLVQPEFKAIGVLIQSPCRGEARHASTNDRNAPLSLSALFVAVRHAVSTLYRSVHFAYSLKYLTAPIDYSEAARSREVDAREKRGRAFYRIFAPQRLGPFAVM